MALFQMEYESDHHLATSHVKRSVCPQDYLDAMIYARGYSTLRHDTLTSAYFNRPTPLQEASYHTHMIDLVRSGNARALRVHLECGMSPIPSNLYGESLVHKVCRVGRSRLLQVMLDCGADVRVADENGRTPMHEACAANSLECFEIICEEDLRMLYMADRQHQVPLQFVPKNAWMDWIQFLEAKKEEFWPESRFGRRTGMDEPPPLFTLQAPNSRPVKDPPNALTFDIAAMVASGQMSPERAQDAMLAKQEDNKRSRDLVEDVSASTCGGAVNYLPVPRQLVQTMDVSDLASELTLSVAGDLVVGVERYNVAGARHGVERNTPDPNSNAEVIGVKTRTIGRGKKGVMDDDDELTVEDNDTHDLDTQTDDRGDLSTIEDIDLKHCLDDPSLNLQGTEAAMGVLGITPRFSPSFSL